MVSILICSFAGSRHLATTVRSITSTIPAGTDYEFLIDVEKERTGLANSTRRYMKLFHRSVGDYIVKSDDDVMYYSGWFELCAAVLADDKKIAYVSPISHALMCRLGIKHASSDSIPIQPKGYGIESVLSGMCWLFNRSLWNAVPYDSPNGNWRLDSVYAGMVRQHGFKTAALNGALVAHLGQDRFKGAATDKPGEPPSEDFKAKHPDYDTRIF